MSDKKTVEYFTFSTKSNQYQIRTKYQDLTSISSIIRAMSKDGMSRWNIHKDSGIRYQHVRNVLITPLAK